MKAGIVGAGILGRLLAFELIQRKWNISLFDENELFSETNCSYAAAGLLSPVFELMKSPRMIYELGLLSLSKWPEIINKLNSSIFYQQTGALVTAHPKENAELKHFFHLIQKHHDASEKIFLLDAKALNELEPDLCPNNIFYHCPLEGQLDVKHLMDSLRSYLLESKLNWHANTHVNYIEPGMIKTEKKQYCFDIVFDCRGLGAINVFDDLYAIRGELAWLFAPNVHIERPIRFLHPRYSLYIVPRPDNIFIIGASEIESDDISFISVRSMLELLTAAYSLHKGFGEARIIKTVTQCRPTLSDGLPIVIYQDGYMAINGLYRHGFLVVPAIIQEVIAMLEKGKQYLQFSKLFKECDHVDLFK